MDLISLNGKAWGRVDKRAFATDGEIIDLGCLDWLWCKSLIGKRKVIGADPLEKHIPNKFVLYKGLVCAYSGKIMMSNARTHSSVMSNRNLVSCNALSFQAFIEKFNIKKINVLKINIEGGEYSLIISLTKHHVDMIDQIAVSFHDFKGGYFLPEMRESCLHYLSHWYDIISIFEQCRWYLCLKK
jgi:hypothetical protein